MNASVAIGLAQKLNTATITDSHPANAHPAQGKTLVLGLVIVSSFIATALVVKVAMMLNDLFLLLDLAYKTGGV